jgi:serine/threonine protein kinase
MPSEQSALRSSLARGQVVGGKYRLVDFVGEGGMGCVFSAEHQILRSMVAIKFMQRDLMRSQDAVRSFIQEAINTQQLAVNNQGKTPTKSTS